MSTGPDRGTPPGFWACRGLADDGSPVWVAGAGSDQHADGELVELPVTDAIAYLAGATLAVAHLGPEQDVVALVVTPLGAPKAPPLWFAELPEPDAAPPALNLVAFTGHDVQPGRLLDRGALRATSARTRDQLGAVRLYPATGEVDQLYVSPQWRRQNIGTALTLAAGILAFARGSSLPWGDGQRTSDGDRMTQASVWRHRAAPLTHLMPPMTPMDERLD